MQAAAAVEDAEPAVDGSSRESDAGSLDVLMHRRAPSGRRGWRYALAIQTKEMT